VFPYPADVAVFSLNARGDALRDFFGAAVGRASNATSDGFSKDEDQASVSTRECIRRVPRKSCASRRRLSSEP